MSASSPCTPRNRPASPANGVRPSSAATASPSASEAGPSSTSYACASAARSRDRVGEQRLLRFERDVLGGILEPGGGDLLHLVAEQVDLPGPGAGVPAEGLELGVERAHRRSFVAVAGQRVERRRARVAVERAALHRGVEQRLVGVLAVEVDERAADLGELARGGEAAVDVGAAAAVAGQDAREHGLLAGRRVDEAPFDPGFGRAVAHERGVGAAADEQLHRFDDEGLARAGLAGDRGHPGRGVEHQVQVGDDPEIDHVQFDEHALPVGEAELGLQDLVEVALATT